MALGGVPPGGSTKPKKFDRTFDFIFTEREAADSGREVPVMSSTCKQTKHQAEQTKQEDKQGLFYYKALVHISVHINYVLRY